MPGRGEVMECAELVVDSVTGQTDSGAGLLKFSATTVGVCPATVDKPSWINRVAAAMKDRPPVMTTTQITANAQRMIDWLGFNDTFSTNKLYNPFEKYIAVKKVKLMRTLIMLCVGNTYNTTITVQ